MNTKQTIRKILFILFWVVIGAGMITLLVAAIGKRKKEVCSNYQVNIKGAKQNFFVDEKDIIKLLAAASGGNIKGKPLKEIKMKKLEELLEDNEWIQDAELWFDNKNVLNIIVTEREPVARVFTTAGNSWYIDSYIKRMSLSDKMTARVPVFTGFPEKKGWTKNDSALANDVKTVAQFVSQNEFWNSQVAQMDIINCGFNCWQFEMIPVVGNHSVKLGDAKNIAEKFNRLYVFYQQVMSKSGFDKYPVLDVQYKGQVVALKEKPKAGIDSIQLRRNLEKLFQQAKEAQNDSVGIINAPRVIAFDTAAASNPAPVNTNNPSRPRAVMKPRNE